MFSFIKKFFKGTLHKACDKGNIEAVNQHLADGADVNAEVGVGQTPLLLAALGGHKVIAELLIAKGADVNAKMEWAEVDSSEITAVQTPLDCAVDHPEIAALLRKHGGKTAEELALMPRLRLLRRPFGFTLNTVEEKTYSIESGSDLKKWNKLREIKGTGNEAKFIDVRKIYFQQHFYRVVVED